MPAHVPEPQRPNQAERRIEIAALLLILVLAVGLRFRRLDSVPPGLHYDEAFNNLYALRIARGEMLPIYIPENNGEEPMHIYLIALLFRLIGPTPLGGRIVSAALGVAAVGVVYFLGRELFHSLGPKAAGRLGLLASLFLAVWYWPVHYNRIGMEPSTVPLVSALAALFLWRTLRTGYRRDALLAGVFTALGLYTYPAGRLVPLLTVVAVAHALLVRRDFSQRALINLLLLAVTSAVVFLPLGLFYWKNPEWFLLRSQQTTVVGDTHPLLALASQAWAALLGLFWRGDQNWRQNLPGRPMLDVFQFTFFIVGAALCVRDFKRGPHWFLFTWAALGLLPTMLTEYAPHFGRALGAAVPLAFITVLGLWAAAEFIANGWRALSRISPVSRSALAAACLGLPLAFSGGRAFDDYFNRWANSRQLYIAFDTGLRAIGEYAARLPAHEPIYLSPVPSDWYTLTFALGDHNRLRSFNGRECLVFPAQTQATTHAIVLVTAADDQRSLPRLESLFPHGFVAWQTYNFDVPYAVDFVIPPGQTAQGRPQFPLRANFAGQIELLGYNVDAPALAPGGQMTVRLWWRALSANLVDYTAFVHLTGEPRPDTGSPLWAQRDTQPCDESYPTTRWAPGEIIWDDYRLDLPPDLPSGTYTLSAGLYDLATGQRLAIETAEAPVNDNVLTLGMIEIKAP